MTLETPMWQEYKNASFDFGVVDKVKVPDLPEGDYVLSWRWEPCLIQKLRVGGDGHIEVSCSGGTPESSICRWFFHFISHPFRVPAFMDEIR